MVGTVACWGPVRWPVAPPRRCCAMCSRRATYTTCSAGCGTCPSSSPGPDGVAPHDLARDVLDADLRWRDFDSYAHVFRKVREHSLASARTTTGRAQQRAIFDLKFLFRQARTAMAPVEWGSWGEYYPERARDEDRGPILELVRAWEGEQSAAIAARWLDRQPEGFSVIRDLDGEVQGMLAIVDLARSSPDDRRRRPRRACRLGLRARQRATEARRGAHAVPVRGRPGQLSGALADAERRPDPDHCRSSCPRRTCRGTSSPWPSRTGGTSTSPRATSRAPRVPTSASGIDATGCSPTTSGRFRWTPGSSCGASVRWHRTSTSRHGSARRRFSCSRIRTSRQPSAKGSRTCGAPTCSRATRSCEPGSSPTAPRGEHRVPPCWKPSCAKPPTTLAAPPSRRQAAAGGRPDLPAPGRHPGGGGRRPRAAVQHLPTPPHPGHDPHRLGAVGPGGVRTGPSRSEHFLTW